MKNIISASRRTDIPAHYYDWFQKGLETGFIMTSNPIMKNGLTTINLLPENVHSIVFWSKDFKNVLDNPGRLQDYNLYFQYTITGYSKFLEPNVPEYKDTLKTLEGLLKRYKPEQFNIRFDPILITKLKGEVNPTPNKPGLARLNVFDTLCKDLKSLGMDNCRLTTSYITMYGNVEKNIKHYNVDMVHLTEKMQVEFIKRMVEIADKHDRKEIYTCSNPIFEGIEGVKKGHCIDGDLLNKLFGKCTKANDSGQRKECGCCKSIDIGGYGKVCKHGCRYCYANAYAF